MARSYDRTEGLVDGQGIKTLRMEYLRCARQSCSRTTSFIPSLYVNMPHVSFQGLLTCNIDGLEKTSPSVIVFTRTLPDSLDTYISHGLRDGASILRGRVNTSHLRGDIGTPTDRAFSVGEMQRLAVVRAFMRPASEEQSVGLLVFDESGASLDPTADQGMTYMTSL